MNDTVPWITAEPRTRSDRIDETAVSLAGTGDWSGHLVRQCRERLLSEHPTVAWSGDA